ncbi:HNH endonuclease [Clostridium tagluense]|uniref:HNH domain-containing protein n=1 Tax=Clostridium tagluense TaxID=360422 RepID=A0A401UQ65_9CLOT|nr:HNH endonuclease [Clostridium tagluense]GCD11685.1 hypothetical protein Ctaglu_33080 [Clostridium tagluense]
MSKQKSKSIIYPIRENEIKLPSGKARKLDRKYSIEEVLKKVNFRGKKESKEDFEGDLIPMNSLRYHTFAKGLNCMCGSEKCHLVGQYFHKERDLFMPTYHFNLYSVDKNGNEILMTKDHTIPSSKGGTDNLENLQTMSEPCNGKKRNNLI